MKPIFLLLIIMTTLTVLSGCKKDEYMTEATITGWNIGSCPCCGGLEVTLASNNTSYPGLFFLLGNEASSLGLSDTVSTFPIYMYAVSYTHLTLPTKRIV